MPQRHCPKCGGFQVTPSPQPSLFDRPLPVRAADDPFAACHRESQTREAPARRRGVTRLIGAERRNRYEFTHACLGGVQ